MDTTIIAVYAICADILIGMRHQEDAQVQLTDAEVMTTAIIAMLFFHGNFAASCRFLSEYGYMPKMLQKSRFNRRLHRIKPMFLTVFAVLGEYWKELDTECRYSIDTFPIAVCDNYRIRRCQLYQDEAFRGKIESKKRYFYGLKLHLMITAQGQPVEFFLTPGAFADVSGLQFFEFDLPEGSYIYADRIYNDYTIEDILHDVHLHFWPMRKKNSTRPFPPYVRFLQHRYRKMIETSGSLLEQMLPKHIHAVTATGFELKAVLFVVALSFHFLAT